mgnify:CR=1 FL=1
MNQSIIDSWNKNSEEWIRVIANNQIESRRYTNKAIEGELKNLAGEKVIDIGCGEGWLTRCISEMGKKAVGIDAIEPLLNAARTKGPESFYQMSYEELMAGKPIPEAPFDIAVYNFCLYQKNGLADLLRATKNQLNAEGAILIQTLHPFFMFDNGLEYKSQMISNSWKGLPGNFIDGHEWYARTFGDWVKIIMQAGLHLNSIKEIVNSNKKPISMILKIN